MGVGRFLTYTVCETVRMNMKSQFERVIARLYFAAKDVEQAGRIVTRGFVLTDGGEAKLPYGQPTFVDQRGIVVSSELDPSTGFAVELEFSTNKTYLRRHELISHVQNVRYYVLMVGDTDKSTRRVVAADQLAAAREAGLEKWQHQPLVWFGK